MKNLNFIFNIAIKYLQSVRRERFMNFITSVAIIGIALGVLALLVSLTILHGFDKTLNSNLISFVGHIQITSFDSKPIEAKPDLIKRIKQTKNIKAVSPFVSKEAIARSNAGLEGILFKGITQNDVSTVRNKMISGKFEDIKRGNVIIGKKLSDKLQLHTADMITMFVINGLPSSQNQPIIEQYSIVGVYETGIGEYDNLYVYGNIDDVRKVANLDSNFISGCDILVNNTDFIKQTAENLEIVVDYPCYPRTVYDSFQSIFAWLDLQRKPIPIVLGLITIVAVFNIIGTLLMVVLEKTESIGTLATIGATPKDIRRIFLMQGLIINTIGLALGIFISVVFTYVQQEWKLISLNPQIYFVDAVPVSFDIKDYLLVIVVSYILCLFATYIPAYIAGKLRPVQALSFK